MVLLEIVCISYINWKLKDSTKHGRYIVQRTLADTGSPFSLYFFSFSLYLKKKNPHQTKQTKQKQTNKTTTTTKQTIATKN